MLIRLVLTNFLSFGPETEFNTLTGSPRRKKEHIYNFGELELLKTAAIYGANGAGKSNLAKGASLLRQIVVEGQWDKVRDIQPFRLDKKLESLPSSLEAEFIIGEQSYCYGLSIQQGKIIEEWLYRTHFGKKDEIVFNRTTSPKGITKIEVHSEFYKTEQDRLRIKLYEEELLKEDQPLITMMANAKQVFRDVRLAYQWFSHYLIIIFPKSKPQFLIGRMLGQLGFEAFANELIASLKTGIHHLELKTYDIDEFFGKDDEEQARKIKTEILKNSNGKRAIQLRAAKVGEEILAMLEGGKVVIKRLIAKHKNEEGQYFDFVLDEESDGTLRLLDLAPALFQSINSPSTVIIDEIDQSVHPFLLKELIKKFVADEQTKGQFIFTTHESNLLDQKVFRQDEIWFAEKNNNGATTLYPLSDFNIRFDLDIQKGYLNGRFGAIPFLGNLEDLNWDIYAKEEQGI
ncbi:MAG: ATP-binding protein [Phaeodactylibacter sp.]|nr:ATP-binding protein [Phaeodactylibacter sp.]